MDLSKQHEWGCCISVFVYADVVNRCMQPIFLPVPIFVCENPTTCTQATYQHILFIFFYVYNRDKPLIKNNNNQAK